MSRDPCVTGVIPASIRMYAEPESSFRLDEQPQANAALVAAFQFVEA